MFIIRRLSIAFVCWQGFSQKGDLTRHMLTHSGERSHVCQDCGRAFAHKETLKKHAATHSQPQQTPPQQPPSGQQQQQHSVTAPSAAVMTISANSPRTYAGRVHFVRRWLVRLVGYFEHFEFAFPARWSVGLLTVVLV